MTQRQKLLDRLAHSSLSFPVPPPFQASPTPVPSPQSPREDAPRESLKPPVESPSVALSAFPRVAPTERSIWPFVITGDMLGNPWVVQEMWAIATKRGWQPNTESTRLRWFTLAESVRRRWIEGDIESPLGAFTNAAKTRAWWGTIADEEIATRNIKDVERDS